MKKVRSRKKIGLAAAPLNGSFTDFKQYIQTEVESRELVGVVKNYVNREFDKKDSVAILANPNYKLYTAGFASMCYWNALDNKFIGSYSHAKEFLTTRFKELCVSGLEVIRENKLKKKVEDKKIVITPAMKARTTTLNTITQDLYDIEDIWLNNKPTPKYNLYKQMTIHDIKSFTDILGWINEYMDDYKLVIDKDEDYVEAYSHLKLSVIKERVKFLQGLLDDVESFKNSKKAVRTIRAKKPKAADKQVERLNFQKDNVDYKLTSINPMRIPGSMDLFVFNTKTRQLTYYVSDTPDGLQVSGSTIKKFSTDLSVVMKLRKPSDLLPDVLKKTPKQITKLIDNLKTKKNIPTGRINKDTIILRCK
jgi:hypothetical protein